MGKQAVGGVHEHVLPHQCRNGRHDEERRDDEDANDTLPPHRLIEQKGEKDAEDHGDQRTPPTITSVVCTAGQKALEEMKRTKLSNPTNP
jgi:hypothetical protein